MSDKDIVEEARELLAAMTPGNKLREADLAPLLNRSRLLLRALADEVERLRKGIRKTLDENPHLADGEVCTLIHLKRSIGED